MALLSTDAEVVEPTDLPTLAVQCRKLADEVDGIAQEVRARLHRGIEQMLRLGKLLNLAKAGTGHGKWLPWLQANLPALPERTARHYMSLATSAGKEPAFPTLVERTDAPPQPVELICRAARSCLKGPQKPKPKKTTLDDLAAMASTITSLEKQITEFPWPGVCSAFPANEFSSVREAMQALRARLVQTLALLARAQFRDSPRLVLQIGKIADLLPGGPAMPPGTAGAAPDVGGGPPGAGSSPEGGGDPTKSASAAVFSDAEIKDLIPDMHIGN